MNRQFALTRLPVSRPGLPYSCGGVWVELARFISKHGVGLDYPIMIDAVCDSMPERCELLTRQPGLRHVRVLPDAEAVMNDKQIDAVWLPLPIHLHAEYTEKMLLAGKAVMIEKPAAASVAEIDRMIKARDTSGMTALVGFQEIYDASDTASETSPAERRSGLRSTDHGPRVLATLDHVFLAKQLGGPAGWSMVGRCMTAH